MNRIERKINRRLFLQISALSGLFWVGCATTDDSSSLALSENISGVALENDSPEFPLADFSVMDGDGTIFAYAAEDILTASPWNESWLLDILPVYTNALVSTDGTGIPAKVDRSAMRNRIIEKARQWGFSEADIMLQADYNAGDNTLQRLYFTTSDVTMSVDTQLNVSAMLTQPISFPDGMKGIHPNCTYSELLEAAQYLLDHYRELLQLTEPQIAIYGGDYNVIGLPKYSLVFRQSDKHQTYAEQLLAATYGTVTVTGNEEGSIVTFTWMHEQTGEYLGDYPIISLKNAQELLCSGKYLTLVPDDSKPKFWECNHAELLYLDTPFADYSLPYYRFLIPLSTDASEGDNILHPYGFFYVCAVKRRL